MAHGFENPIGWVKAELLIEQHPELQVKLVTQTFYQRLQRHFENLIDETDSLCGWEKTGNNLKTNPEKYALFA